MSAVAVFASQLGQAFHWLFALLAWFISVFYALIPNYAVAIALLTIVVMIVTAPLTVKSTKSMSAMQRVAPEMKKLQAKYKGDRQTLNEEMMKLYKEHGVNPAGGCLPLFIQMPVFFILYAVIRGLTYTVKTGHYWRNTAGVLVKCVQGPCASPQYIGHTTKLYSSLLSHNGKMPAFGIDLAAKVFSHHTFVQGIPYAALILVAIGLQYFQMRQLNSRNPGMAQANPQAQAIQRYMPLIFAVIYINIAAGVNVYFIVSTLCRIGIQEWVFRSGILTKSRARASEEALPGGGTAAPRRRTLMERLADAQKKALEQQSQQKTQRPALQQENPKPKGPNSSGTSAKPAPGAPKDPTASAPPKQSPTPNSTSGNGQASPNGAQSKKPPQSRSKAKRGRKAR